MSGAYELYNDKAGEFLFHVKAGNGQNILVSEDNKAKGSAESGIESVRQNSPWDKRKATKSGKFMFNLKTANCQAIATNESYEIGASRDNGIAAVEENVPHATRDCGSSSHLISMLMPVEQRIRYA